MNYLIKLLSLKDGKAKEMKKLLDQNVKEQKEKEEEGAEINISS